MDGAERRYCQRVIMAGTAIERESTTMEATVRSANSIPSEAANDGAVVGLVSAIVFAAAGSLLSYSLLSRKRPLPVAGQLFLGVLTGCAGVMTWKKRQDEALAARHLVEHMHDVRDARWLRKNPVAYG
jgi:hypothetical protein